MKAAIEQNTIGSTNMAFDMDNYQYLVKRFKKDTANQMYLLLGLSGEVGELHSKAAKHIRDETPEDKEALKAELGDVLWFVAMLADTWGFDLGEVAQSNYTKLKDRFERNVIGGSGDNR